MRTSVPLDCLAEFKARVESFTRRVAKHGFPAPTITYGATRVESVFNRMNTAVVGRMRWVDVEIDCPVVSAPGGWRLLAKIEHLPAANVVTNPRGEDVGVEWSHAPPACVHCQTKRGRSVTYLVTDPAGEVRQVGGSCVVEYTGMDPAKLAAFDLYVRFFAECGEGGGTAKTEIDTTFFLAVALALVSRDGYKPAAQEEHSTAGRALQWYYEIANRDTGAAEVMEHYDRAVALRAEALALKPTTVYLWNLHAVLSQDTLDRRHIGLAASIIQVQERAAEERAKAPVEVDAPLAPDGTKYSAGKPTKKEQASGTVHPPLAVTYVRSASYDNAYGGGMVIVMRADSGHRLVWFGSHDAAHDFLHDGFDRIEAGTACRIVGTVKGSKRGRDGVTETILTRVSRLREISAAA